MKKHLLPAVLILAVAGFCAVYFSQHPNLLSTQRVSSAAVSSGAASSAMVKTVSAAPAVSSRAAVLAKAETTGADSKVAAPAQSEGDKVKAAIPLNWTKYSLKSSSPKTIKGKTYHTYDIRDDDYFVGPKILVDPSDGAIYTWTASDTAPLPASQDKAFDKTVHTITGVMEDGAMMNVMLKTDDGSEINVRRLGIDTTNLKSLKIGDRIRVTYTGVIKGSDTSRAFITKLENV